MRLLPKSFLVGSGIIVLLLLLVLVGMILFPSESLWFYIALERGYLFRNLVLESAAIMIASVTTAITVAVMKSAYYAIRVRIRRSALQVS